MVFVAFYQMVFAALHQIVFAASQQMVFIALQQIVFAACSRQFLQHAVDSLDCFGNGLWQKLLLSDNNQNEVGLFEALADVDGTCNKHYEDETINEDYLAHGECDKDRVSNKDYLFEESA